MEETSGEIQKQTLYDEHQALSDVEEYDEPIAFDSTTDVNSYTTENKTLLDDIWVLWKKYLDYFVVSNSELKKVYFHVLLGVYLTDKEYSYLESGSSRSLRLHCFGIQNSGTGKGQMMTSLHNQLAYMGIESRKTIKDNETSMSGSIYKDKKNGKTVMRKGLLHKLKCHIWLEGSVLLNPSPYMDSVTDMLQGVMDEPGEVSKGMKYGTVEYPSPTTIIAGSYMFNEFQTTLMKKGFLQRMYISYKIFTEAEERDMRIGVNQLKMRRDPEKIKQCMEGIKALCAKIKVRNEPIRFSDSAISKFNADLEKVYQEYITNQFVGEKQEILKTFFNRFHCIVDKIAAQVAIVKGKKEVEYDDMLYARELCEYHLQSLLHIFDSMTSSKAINVFDNREDVIVSFVRKANGGIVLSDLLDILKQLKKKGNWDLGYNRSLEVINKMINKKIINTAEGKGHTKILFI